LVLAYYATERTPVFKRSKDTNVRDKNVNMVCIAYLLSP
jgi:hypothetical protein